MKKSIVLPSAFLFVAIASFSQSTSFGIKAAVTANNLTFRIGDDDDNRLIGGNTGFYAGGVANFEFSERFSIQPNLLFAMKGGSVEGIKITTFHVDLPINFLYTHNGFFIGGGPNISYGISATGKSDGEKIDLYDQEEAGELTLKKFEIGANALMGFTFPNGLSISASFTPGLSNIYKGEEDNDQDIVAHNKSFGLSVGYMFGAKGKK